MASVIDPAALAASARAYVARDWQRARDLKRTYWRARLDRGGLTEALAITDQLRRELKQRVPTWPSEREREEDLETHRRVAAALARTPRPPAQPAARPRRRARRIR
jgi:hypothetical protein